MMRRDRTVDLAFIGACVLLLGVAAYRLAAAGSAPRPRLPGYTVGERLSTDLIPSDARFDRALLLILHSQCAICTESIPFYKSVAAERSARHHPMRLFVLAREDPSTVRNYLAQYGLAVDGIFPISHAALKGTGFPTLLVVDQERTVTGVWRGRLSPPNQAKVMSRIFEE